MFAFGPKQTSLVAPHMSAFGARRTSISKLQLPSYHCAASPECLFPHADWPVRSRKATQLGSPRMEPVESSRALHRRRGKNGHDQQGDLQPLPAGAPQCRGDRCGPGRSELRGDRRGGEPATRAESADAEAAGGCGSFNIEATPNSNSSLISRRQSVRPLSSSADSAISNEVIEWAYVRYWPKADMN